MLRLFHRPRIHTQFSRGLFNPWAAMRIQTDRPLVPRAQTVHGAWAELKKVAANQNQKDVTLRFFDHFITLAIQSNTPQRNFWALTKKHIERLAKIENPQVRCNVLLNLYYLSMHRLTLVEQLQGPAKVNAESQYRFTAEEQQIGLSVCRDFLDPNHGVYHTTWNLYKELHKQRSDFAQHWLGKYHALSKRALHQKVNQLQTAITYPDNGQPQKFYNPFDIETEAQLWAARMTLHPEFAAIVIPNRGLIAKKIIQKAKAQGYETVMICNKADSLSSVAEEADVVLVVEDPNSIAECKAALHKFLQMRPKKYGVAVHPGYGYHAEKPEFVRMLSDDVFADYKVVYIGPSAQAKTTLGDKANFRKHASASGVSVPCGYQGAQDMKSIVAAAKEIGFPDKIKTLMVKRSTAGTSGAGTGNRVVTTMNDLENAVTVLQGQGANKAEVLLEECLTNPQHYEVQFIVDNNGNVVIAGIRICSYQLANQKIVEIGVNPNQLEPKLYATLVARTKKLVENVGYQNAGTAEFLITADSRITGNEVNPRIQVEAPCTSDVLLPQGVDMIDWQIHNARGGANKDFLRDCLLRRGVKVNDAWDEQCMIKKLYNHTEINYSVQIRLNAAVYTPTENGFMVAPVQGRVREINIPKTMHGVIEIAVRPGELVDTLSNVPQIGSIRGFGKTLETALYNAIGLARKLEITGIETAKDVFADIIDHCHRHGITPHVNTCKEIGAQWFAAAQSSTPQLEQPKVKLSSRTLSG